MTSVLILAGRRGGAHDPLAAAAGVSHKCVVPVAGRPLIEHVLDAALGWPEADRILISIDDPAPLEALPRLARPIAEGRVRILPAYPKLPASILAAAKEARFPLVVTTADNVLLTSHALAEFAHRAEATEGEAAVAVARREAVLAAHPEGQRRFYHFADGAFSGCNLYWIGREEALRAVRAFEGGGQFAKHPARIAAAFGILNMIRFRLGWLSLPAMMARLSHALDVPIRTIEMADGRLAIDVDNERTHRIAGELLADETRLVA